MKTHLGDDERAAQPRVICRRCANVNYIAVGACWYCSTPIEPQPFCPAVSTMIAKEATNEWAWRQREHADTARLYKAFDALSHETTDEAREAQPSHDPQCGSKDGLPCICSTSPPMRLPDLFSSPVPETPTPREAQLREALKSAERFIVNGIKYGYISMPSMESDTAHQTLPMIRAALQASSPEPRNADQERDLARGVGE